MTFQWDKVDALLAANPIVSVHIVSSQATSCVERISWEVGCLKGGADDGQANAACFLDDT